MSNEQSVPQFTDFVHRFIPAKSDDEAGKKLPTLLLLHGTGGNEDDLLDLGRSLVPGAALLSPRGKVLENGMPRFFRRLAEGIFDLEDLQRRTDELADFVSAASEAYHFDPTQVVALGYSNGANIAASMLLLRPGILHGAILLRAMIQLVPDPLPELAGIPTLIHAGNMDPIIPVAQTEQLVHVLRQAGASVTERWMNVGHGLTREDLRSAKAWLQKTYHI
ncbi:alpha/beta hydrolase [Dictyobacter arantiisoli]|uniref:Hydrolase n=1 Tax=Dictyobacter arantiisoli TaxID=2014874 RepID=A0A5A5T6X7_9CHLR|nr:alpha/beta hydrolase [Dictyobacter arantiisoli]GCF06763.1 hydrolase [Dictyobacter arantiisoli]